MPSSATETAVEQKNPDFATYQELADLEHEFDEVEDEIIRKQYELTKPLYTKRRSLISRIENFWSLALELAPQEIDQFVQPSDSGVFAECLKDIEVSRFELDSSAPGASPRSFSVKFTFTSNEWFEDEVLEKKFWYRYSKAHGSGLVSEPVKINWKAGKDLTQGLTDAAVELWAAKSKSGAGKSKSITKLAEYKKLAELLEENDRSSVSFFTFFAYVSEHTFVSADESVADRAAETERRKKRSQGQEATDEDDEEEQEKAALAVAEWEDVEVCPHGSELATVIADEFWPNALKYFVESNQMADGPDDFSDMDSDDGIESEDDDGEENTIDIRGLVGDNKRKDKASSPGSASPPASKNRKKA